MPPKTKQTADEVAAELIEKNINVTNPVSKNKHPGINKDIQLTTEIPTFEQIWPKE